MRSHRKSKGKVQKVKKNSATSNEQYKSVVITVPKKMINRCKLDELYKVDRLHTEAVNLWIASWYWRLDMVERILAGNATTQMQKETIPTTLLTAYIQIAGNRMLDILREHYLAVQDKLATNIWKAPDLTPEYKFVYATMARNNTLFARFINANFTVDDIIAKWAGSDSEYLQKAAVFYRKLTFTEQQSIPVRIFCAFLKLRWRWSMPVFKGGSILLDYRVFSISESQETTEFNFWMAITSTKPYKRIQVPFYVTAKKLDILSVLSPNWYTTTRRKGLLVIRGRHIHLSIPVAKEQPVIPKNPAAYIGCDIGMTTAINLDNGKQYGTSFSELVKKNYDEYLRLQSIRNKIRALRDKKANRLKHTINPDKARKLKRKIAEYDRHLQDRRWSKLRYKIKATVKTEIGRVVNQLLKAIPLNSVFIMEDLTEMSAEGAKRCRRGRFDLSVWSRGELQKHIQEDLAWYRATQVQYVAPEYTSQLCPKCGHVAGDNRQGKVFCCKRCNYKADADINAAKNIKERFFDKEVSELVRKYSWNKDLRRKKILELLQKRANQAA